MYYKLKMIINIIRWSWSVLNKNGAIYICRIWPHENYEKDHYYSSIKIITLNDQYAYYGFVVDYFTENIKDLLCKAYIYNITEQKNTGDQNDLGRI